VSDVVIVDYGAGNTRSVRAALSHLGRESVVTNDPTTIRESAFVILPGVGSARSAMDNLNASGAATALKERFDDGRPILGICLGLQLAMTTLEEDGGVKGLGLLDGDVIRIHDSRVPRLGWSVVDLWGEAFYFAHSYAVLTPHAIAGVDGVTVAAQRGAFLGVQFHPEKSGPAGLEFLDQCLSLV
jgi:glutamine amidotransferase